MRSYPHLLLLKIKIQLRLFVECQMKNPTPVWIFLFYPFMLIYQLMLSVIGMKNKMTVPKTLTICIGNITTGGNGKTPFLIHLAQELNTAHPIILSKGYQRKDQKDQEVLEDDSYETVGDEPLLIKKSLLDTPVFVARSRYDFVQSKQGYLFLLDDGFQDRKLKADINFILFDKRHFLRQDYLLPLGVFRQPWDVLKKCSMIFIKGPISQQEFEKITTFFKNKNIQVPIGSFSLKIKAFVSSSIKTFNPNLKTAVFSGIGEPASFISSLEEAHVNISTIKILPDHFSMDPKAFISWVEQVIKMGVQQIVCTKKDAIKLQEVQNLKLPLFFPEIQVVIENGKKDYAEWIEKIKNKQLEL